MVYGVVVFIVEELIFFYGNFVGLFLNVWLRVFLGGNLIWGLDNLNCFVEVIGNDGIYWVLLGFVFFVNLFELNIGF